MNILGLCKALFSWVVPARDLTATAYNKQITESFV